MLRNRLKNFILINKLNYTALFLLIIGIAIGLFITAQFRSLPVRISDPVISYSALIQTKDELIKEQESLKERIKVLNAEAQESQKKLKEFSETKIKAEKVEQYEGKIGLTELQGKGVVIKLDDSNNPNSTISSIAHAADLRDIVNFLWGLDISAISINDERIVFNTSIDCIINTILINSTKTVPPFIVKVIGDNDYIYNSLNNPNFLEDIHRRKSTEGLIFEIEKKDNIVINPYLGSMQINFAKIIE